MDTDTHTHAQAQGHWSKRFASNDALNRLLNARSNVSMVSGYLRERVGRDLPHIGPRLLTPSAPSWLKNLAVEQDEGGGSSICSAQEPAEGKITKLDLHFGGKDIYGAEKHKVSRCILCLSARHL
eukprot:scaffold76373_cov19-Tisochrysis_lutea.AAC.1